MQGGSGSPSKTASELCCDTDQVDAFDSVLAATANPTEVDVSQPSVALVAQAGAKGALNSLLLGLGAAVCAARMSPTEALWSV